MMWFLYERDFARRWVPVVYHGDKPNPRKDGSATGAIEVPPDCIGPDGQPMFGRLQAKFPPPKEQSS